MPAHTLSCTAVRCVAGSAPSGRSTASVDFFSTTTTADSLTSIADIRAVATSAALLPSVAAAGMPTPTVASNARGGYGGREGGGVGGGVDGGNVGGREGGGCDGSGGDGCGSDGGGRDGGSCGWEHEQIGPT